VKRLIVAEAAPKELRAVACFLQRAAGFYSPPGLIEERLIREPFDRDAGVDDGLHRLSPVLADHRFGLDVGRQTNLLAVSSESIVK
jgi:hypothetical protein